MKLNEVYEVKIERMNNEASGVGHVDGMVVFVKNALIGEVVKIKIDEINKNYAVGSIIEIIDKSLDRRVPTCPFYYDCGGCNLMHIDYNKQLDFKKEKIQSIFRKICNEDIDLNIYSFNNYNYRNKVVLKVKEDKVGYYRYKTNELVDINNCMIIRNELNEYLLKFRKFIKDNKNNFINEIMIRICNDEIMISLDNINCDIKDIFIEEFKSVSSIYINNELVYGVSSLNQKINDLVFDVSHKSFFQVNKEVAEKLYNKALEYVSKSDTTVDLYSGTGTISMLLSKKSRKVIGIEVVKEAVLDAKNNLLLNDIDNVEFVCDKVENKIELLKDMKIDNLIMDPPRGGSDKKTLKSLLNIEPNRIIYISCNPITLARDYNVLKEKYKIKDIVSYDMFPQTIHVETICVLERR